MSIPNHNGVMNDVLDYLDDLEAFDAALTNDAPTVPWETIKAELGW